MAAKGYYDLDAAGKIVYVEADEQGPLWSNGRPRLDAAMRVRKSETNGWAAELTFAALELFPPGTEYSIVRDASNERIALVQGGPHKIGKKGKVPGVTVWLRWYGIEPPTRVPVRLVNGNLVVDLSGAIDEKQP